MNEVRIQVLGAVCDTVCPPLERPGDSDGFWARSGTDVGADQTLMSTIEGLPPEQREGLWQLVDGLAQMGFLSASRRSREQLLRNLRTLGPAAELGGQTLVSLALLFAYGMPDVSGRNAFWASFGYPGPSAMPEQRPRTVTPLVPAGEDAAYEADAVVVGSGAGGSVIAAALAGAGLKVLVLEAGGLFDESDFNQYELWAYQNLYWRGGPNPTADMNVALYAGATYGGGTTINWTNCLRTKPWVREQWAREFGLEGLDGAAFDRHLDSVWQRLSVNDRCSDLNGTQESMKRGAEALGWSFATCNRNIDETLYSPETAGYIGFGDQTGAKQSTPHTYLADAIAGNAEVMVRTTAQRVLVENGRAAGVEAVHSDPASGGVPTRVAVRAPRVIVAAGALESPALLLRSGIGGPAVGHYLRVHPCTAVFGSYADDQRAWWGAPHAGLVDEFADAEDGYGFLLEATQYAPGTGASALPFTGGEAHKQAMSEYRYGSTFIGLVRDHGSGRVTLDAAALAQPWYSLTDELDVRNTHRAIEAQVRLHVAAGAREISALAGGLPRWRVGDDVDAFVARLKRVPLRAGGFKLFAAHQMGTCRMGTNAQQSVANPYGELHDTPGVWIGDASAFPTPSGTNPMITIMALAQRTGEAILAASPATAAVTA